MTAGLIVFFKFTQIIEREVISLYRDQYREVPYKQISRRPTTQRQTTWMRWCKNVRRCPGLAIIAVFMMLAIVVAMSFIGIIGKSKLDTANTSLWTVRQERNQLQEQMAVQAEQYEQTISDLRAELVTYRDAEAEAKRVAFIESFTPEEAYRFSGVESLVITTKDSVRVRPSPYAGEISYGRLNGGTRFQLEYFYATKLPQNGIGSWIGIPVQLLSDDLSSFPQGIADDTDGIVWISADYLNFSDYLRNYDSPLSKLE